MADGLCGVAPSVYWGRRRYLVDSVGEMGCPYFVWCQYSMQEMQQTTYRLFVCVWFQSEYNVFDGVGREQDQFWKQILCEYLIKH